MQVIRPNHDNSSLCLMQILVLIVGPTVLDKFTVISLHRLSVVDPSDPSLVQYLPNY